MFMKSALRAPFYFFAGEDGGGAGAGGGTGGAPAGALGVVSSEPVHGTAGDPGPDPKPATPEPKPTPAAKPAAGDPAPKPAPKPAAGDPAPKPAGDPAARTAADGGGGEPEPPKATDPLPWEDQAKALAKGDKKLEARLIRQGGVEGIINAWRAMEVERDSGKWAKKLPTHPTAEELVEYQKANAIPEKPEGYDDNIGNGFVWGEADKDALDHFKSFAHERNMTPAEVKRSLEWYPLYQEHIVNQLNESDVNNAALAKNDFRATWGAKEPANLTFIRNQFESTKGLFGTIANARGPDGRRIGDNPEAMKFFFEKFKDADPSAYDLPGNGSSPGQSDDARLGELRKMMRDPNSAYKKGPQSMALQQEFRDLIERQQRREARAAL